MDEAQVQADQSQVFAAQDAVATQDRHAHQRMVDLLAGLGAVREIGVRLRIGEGQRAGGRGNLPDQPLADP